MTTNKEKKPRRTRLTLATVFGQEDPDADVFEFCSVSKFINLKFNSLALFTMIESIFFQKVLVWT